MPRCHWINWRGQLKNSSSGFMDCLGQFWVHGCSWTVGREGGRGRGDGHMNQPSQPTSTEDSRFLFQNQSEKSQENGIDHGPSIEPCGTPHGQMCSLHSLTWNNFDCSTQIQTVNKLKSFYTVLVEEKKHFQSLPASLRADSLYKSSWSQTEGSALTSGVSERQLQPLKRVIRNRLVPPFQQVLLMSATEEKKIQTGDTWMRSGRRHAYNLAKIDRGGRGQPVPSERPAKNQESSEAPNRRRETNGTQTSTRTSKQRTKMEEWAENYCLTRHRWQKQRLKLLRNTVK